MEGSKLGYKVWALAFYLLATGVKGTSSLRLHRDLGITQSTAWHLAHRIRETWRDNRPAEFSGTIEVNEAYLGGREKNKHSKKRLRSRWIEGKTIVAGIRERKSGKVKAGVIKAASARELKGFIRRNTKDGTKVYTDEAAPYNGLENRSWVNHSVGQYVSGQAHTNGMESFWALLKRGYHGTYHKMSRKHLPRYVAEFEGRHNQRPLDDVERSRAPVMAPLRPPRRRPAPRLRRRRLARRRRPSPPSTSSRPSSSATRGAHAAATPSGGSGAGAPGCTCW